MPAREAMVIRVCGAILVREGGVPQSFSTGSIRGASGPIRYNPQVPGRAKPTRRETSEDGAAGVSPSQPQPLLSRWTRRAPNTDTEWGLRKKEEQKRFWEEQEDDDVGKDARAEMQRLKAEMQLRDSRTQLSQAFPSSSQKHEEVLAVVAVEEAEVATIADLGKIPAAARPHSFGTSGLFYGDGRKFEGLNSALSNSNPSKKNALEGSGLFYGDGRKVQGPETDSLQDSAEDVLFEAEEEDKTVVKEKQAARNYSLRLLAMASQAALQLSPQTAHKLRQKLIDRSVSAPVIESTIADLQRCGLQSDLEYAEAFARSRWWSALWGPQRLKQELKLRGVCSEDVATALEKVFTTADDAFPEEAAEAGDDSEAAAVWGMTRVAKEHLLEKARLQWTRGDEGVSRVSAETRKRRMIGWLQRRGFNWSITSQILKSLESEECK